MAYRETAKTRKNREARHGSILDAALHLTSIKGFSGTTVAGIAELAGVATGSVYRYFPNKAELSSKVFCLASGMEMEKVAAALAADGSPKRRLAVAIRQFAWRAFKGRQLAYALIAEPTDPMVEADRLEYRRRYAALFSAVVKEGAECGEFPAQHIQLAGSAIVGAMAESLIGPLSTSIAEGSDRDIQHEWIEQLVLFCLRAVGAESGTRQIGIT
jgi:AcrR family transcriptional regulator